MVILERKMFFFMGAAKRVPNQILNQRNFLFLWKKYLMLISIKTVALQFRKTKKERLELLFGKNSE